MSEELGQAVLILFILVATFAFLVLRAKFIKKHRK
jgi:hypothetical protein